MDNILKRVLNLYSGRIDQQQFIILAIIMFVVSIFMIGVGAQISITFGNIGFVINSILQIIVTILTLHLYVRRLHDAGATGWAVFIVIFSVWIHVSLGIVCFLILALLPQIPFRNQFGEVPEKSRPLLQTFLNT